MELLEEKGGSGSNKHLLDWDETDVQSWFVSLGMPSYERQIREHKIQGDILCMLDSDGLKALGITSIGQRLSLLKAIYHLKLANAIPLGDDDYVPPSESFPISEGATLEHIHTNVKEQGSRLHTLEEDNRTLSLAMRSFSEEITKLRSSLGLNTESALLQLGKLPNADGEVQAVDQLHKDENNSKQVNSTEAHPAKPSLQTPLPTPSTGQDSADSANPSKVNLDDPTWKVLPAALKKHRINMEEWPNYAMFISYGPPGDRTKRRLELEEKPLYLFKKLKEAKQNPAFLLKNMRDLRSPLQMEGTTPQSQASTFSQFSSNTNHLQPNLPTSRHSPGS